MTTHYDTSSSVKLRCDGDHSWGEEYLGSSSIDVVLDDGEICVKISWSVEKQCTNKHTNDVKTTRNECQKVTVADRNSIVVPVDSIKELCKIGDNN